MTSQYDLEPEEIELAKKQAASSLIVRRDVDSDIRRKAKYDATQKLREEQEKEYADKVTEIEEQRERLEKARYENQSQGRKVNPHQILFKQGVCEYCDSECFFVLEGFNPWRTTQNYPDLTIPYSAELDSYGNHNLRHQCSPDNTIATAKRITALEDKLEEFKKFVEYRYSKIPSW